MLVENIH